MSDRDELAAWLRLIETHGVGRASARRLLAAFGSAEAAIDASTPARREVVGEAAARALATPPEGFDAKLEATWAWLQSDTAPARHFITLGDPGYPGALLETADPPLALYALVRWATAHGACVGQPDALVAEAAL